MIKNDIDKRKNYIKTNKGLIGPIEPSEIISYVEQGMIQDDDEIFLPSKNSWEKLRNIHELYNLKPKHTLEFEYPDLVDVGNNVIEKNISKQLNEYNRLEKIARYKRIQISLPLKYRKKSSILANEKEFQKATSIDLSISGLSFEVYGSVFMPETILEIKINFPGFKETFISIVKIERVSKGFNDQYIIGVKFIEMKIELKKMLISYIREEIVKRNILESSFKNNKY